MLGVCFVPPVGGAPVRFDVPALPAPAGLVRFARQAGLEVLFSPADVQPFRTNAVSGEHEPELALALLLLDTGLNSVRVAPGRYVVTPAPQGRVSGRVLAGPGGTGLGGVRVGLPNRTIYTRTARDGRFSLGAVPVGRHEFAVAAAGRPLVQVSGVVVEADRETVLQPVTVPPGDGTEALETLVVDGSTLQSGPGVVGPPFQLARMVLTPSRFGFGEGPALSTATLNQADLSALPQLGDDLFRAIAKLPGLASSDISAKFWVRGAPHEQVLTRLDGADLLEPYHMKDVDGALSIIDLETVARLDLFTGGFTAEYGDRLAGVLTMESETRARPGRQTTLGLSLTGARLTTRGATDSGRVSWLLSGRSGYPDIALEMQGSGGEVKPRYHDLFSKVELRVNSDHTLAFHALAAADSLTFREEGDSDLHSDYDSTYFWARWRGSWQERLRGEAVLTHSRVGWHRLGETRPTDFLQLNLRDDRELVTTGLRQDWSYLASDQILLRGGLDYAHQAMEYRYRRTRDVPVINNGNLELSRRVLNLDFDPEGTAAGLYGAVRFQPRPELTLEAGARYDRQDVTGRDSRMLSPRLNAAWGTGRTSVRVAWGLHHQAQGLHQIAIANGDNSIFGPERAEHRVLSVEHRRADGVNLRAEFYDRNTADPRPRWENLSDPYDVFPETQYDRVRLTPTRARATGIELIAERRGPHKLQWAASYAWAESTETLGGREVPRSRDQRHTIALDAHYRPNPRWQFSVAWQFHSGWPTTENVVTMTTFPGGGLGTLQTIGTPYAVRLPAYHRLDLRATRYFQLRDSTLRVFVDVFNAYDRANAYRYDYSSQIVNGQVVVTRTEEKLFPLLPSLGVMWDF